MDSQKMMASEISAIYFCLLMICMNKWIWHLWRSGVFFVVFFKLQPRIKSSSFLALKSPHGSFCIHTRHLNLSFKTEHQILMTDIITLLNYFFSWLLEEVHFFPRRSGKSGQHLKIGCSVQNCFFYSGITTKFPGKKNMLIFFPMSLNRIWFNMLTELDGVNA